MDATIFTNFQRRSMLTALCAVLRRRSHLGSGGAACMRRAGHETKMSYVRIAEKKRQRARFVSNTSPFPPPSLRRRPFCNQTFIQALNWYVSASFFFTAGSWFVWVNSVLFRTPSTLFVNTCMLQKKLVGGPCVMVFAILSSGCSEFYLASIRSKWEGLYKR